MKEVNEMTQEIYDFFERYAGVSYDFDEDLNNISGYVAFIEPYQWHSGISEILTNLEEAIDCIDEFGDNLGDEMPSKRDLKKIVAREVLEKLFDNINNVKRNLCIEITDISSYDDLEKQVGLLGDLINMLVSNSLDEILGHDMFNEYENDDDGGGLHDILGISEGDMPNMSLIVTSIREDYFASLDEDGE